MSQTIDTETYQSRQTEAEFQATVIEFAEYSGWVCAHTRDSRGEADGEPDLRCWRGDRYLLAELKTEKGIERQSQKLWRFRAEQRGITVYLWRPRDWEALAAVLERPENTKMASQTNETAMSGVGPRNLAHRRSEQS